MKIVHLPNFMSVKKILIFSYLSALALNLNLGAFSSEEYFEDNQDESYMSDGFFLDNEDDETTLNQEFVSRTSPYKKIQTNSVPVQQSQNKPYADKPN